MASISSPGLGSGIDVNGLVTQLVAASRQPAENRLAFKEATLQAEITAFGTLKGALSSFQSTLNFLSSLSAFQDTPATSSDETYFTASADSNAVAGSYDIEISELAKSHTLVTTGFADTDTTVVGTGTLTFKFGTTDYTPGTDTYTSFTPNADKATQTVTIDSTNNTLEGMRDAINNAGIGVNAGIIFDGTDHRLTISSEDSGAANSMEITVDDTGDSNHTDVNGLSRLVFSSGATNLEQTLAAQDAALKINGLDVSSDTNSISDAIAGVTLDLHKKDAAVTTTLDVAKNTSVVSNSVTNLVNSYNSLVTTISDISGYDSGASQGGILIGDSATRYVSSQLRSTLNSAFDSLGGSYRSLSEIGITTERDGTLKIDNAKLNEEISNDPGAVARIFALSGVPSDSKINYTSSTSDTVASDYAVNITQAATQGALTGSTFGYGGTITIDTNSDELSVVVDGISSGTITLTQGSYTGAELATELQARINGDSALQAKGVTVKVAFNGDNTFSITSENYGDGSKVEIATLDTDSTADFGLSAGTGTDGLNVAGTIGGLGATGSGRFLTGSHGDAKGLKIEVSGDATGSYGTINFTRGLADQLENLVSSLLASDGAINARLDGSNDRVKDIESQREVLNTRMAALQSRYSAQFLAMDLLVSKLQGTSAFLGQQLGSIPEIGILQR